jgi:hypothetical protein
VTTIDGEETYFIHVRFKHPNAMPLIMTHGWPGSIIYGVSMAHQFLNRCQLHALRLIGDSLLFGQTRRCEALAEVEQSCFRNVDAEGSDVYVFRLDVRFCGSRGRLVARTKRGLTRENARREWLRALDKNEVLHHYEKMLTLYPSRVNPGSLWAAAKALKGSAKAYA